MSNDRAKASTSRLGRGVVTTVPLTSNVAQVHPFPVLLTAQGTGLRVESKVQGEQDRSVSVERLGQVIGRVPAHQMAKLDAPSVLTFNSDLGATAAANEG